MLLDASNAGVPVSYTCWPYDPVKDISPACRGAVHCSQILAQKKRQGTEMDHVNDGGMAGLIKRWLASIPLTKEQVATHIMPATCSTAVHGALLSQWQDYHRQHAVLEEVTPEEHRKRTKARRQQ
jgi:hypothetical protein